MSTDSVKTLQNITQKELTLGNCMWAIRMCDNLSQKEFAARLGVSSQYLCDLEHGRKIVSPKKAKEFAEKLGQLPEQFIELALQDMLKAAGIDMKVTLQSAA